MSHARVGVLWLAVVCSGLQLGALRTAAGGNPDGPNGFHRVVRFLDSLGDYAMWIGPAACVLGLIIGGIRYALGQQDAVAWLAGAAAGLCIVLLAPAIMA